MHKTRRTTVAALAALTLTAPTLTACNLPGVSSTCEAFSLSTTVGGKGGGGGKGTSGKTGTKSKPKTKVGGAGAAGGGAHRNDGDDCDDD